MSSCGAGWQVVRSRSMMVSTLLTSRSTKGRKLRHARTRPSCRERLRYCLGMVWPTYITPSTDSWLKEGLSIQGSRPHHRNRPLKMSLKVFVQSPDTFGERRFDPTITIEALKVSLRNEAMPPHPRSRYSDWFSTTSDVIAQTRRHYGDLVPESTTGPVSRCRLGRSSRSAGLRDGG